MTKEGFEVLQLDLQQSGKSVKDYLQEAGVNYSTYNYWRKKLLVNEAPKPELAPISFTQHADPAFSSSVPSGATLLFPKGMSGVLIAPMPLLPIYKGIAGASLLAEILLQKYEYHMPYYRQIKQYSHLGMKGLTESTVDGWFKQTMELLRPLYEVLKSEVMKADYVQADETTTPVINKETHKAAKEYLWMVRAVMERLVLFHYDQGSRAGAVIESLANRYHFKGYLQCDGFAGYETAFKTNPRRAPC